MPNADALVIAAGAAVYAAPVGTALPVSYSVVPNAAFIDLGHIHEDGVSFSQSPNSVGFKSWLTSTLIRRELIDLENEFTFGLQEWTAATLNLALYGGTVAEPDNVTYPGEYEITQGDQIVERAVLIEYGDGNNGYRIILPKLSIEVGEVTFNREERAILPVTANALYDDTAAYAVRIQSNATSLDPA